MNSEAILSKRLNHIRSVFSLLLLANITIKMWKYIVIIWFQVLIHCTNCNCDNDNGTKLSEFTSNFTQCLGLETENLVAEKDNGNGTTLFHSNIPSDNTNTAENDQKEQIQRMFLKRFGFFTAGVFFNVMVACCWVMSRSNKRILNNNLEFQLQQQQLQRSSPSAGSRAAGHGTPMPQRRITTGQFRLSPGCNMSPNSGNSRQAQGGIATPCRKTHEKLSRKDSTPPPSYSSLQIHYIREIKSVEIPIFMSTSPKEESKYPPAYTP